MPKNLLTVKRFNDALQTYQNYRTEWLGDADTLRVEHFMQKNASVPGFYQYTLTKENGESIVHETLCADLTEYAQHQAKHNASLIQKAIEHV